MTDEPYDGMLRKRAATGEERARMRELVGYRGRRVDDWIVGLLAPFALLFVPLLLLQSAFPALARYQLTILILLFLVGSGLALAMRRRRGSGARASLSLAELREGLVEEGRFTVRDALRVEPEAGGVPAYYLDVGDGRTLFLRGAYLESLTDDGRVPAGLVTVRTPITRQLVSAASRGGSVRPSAARPPFSAEELGDEESAMDGDLLEIPFAEVVDLEKAERLR